MTKSMRCTAAGILCLLCGAAVPAQSIHPSRQTLEAWIAGEPDLRIPLDQLQTARNPLSREEAAIAAHVLWEDIVQHEIPALTAEWKDRTIRVKEQHMVFDYRTFGKEPAAGWDLFISLHGGGNAPRELNEQQWRNQIQLYQPDNAIYIAPRAPTDTWNLWHESHIDALLDRLIYAAVLVKNANPDRIYLMGYSAGGDGVYQLAPRMADRWAAAAMMAGHPNETSPLGLRNIGFTIHVGADDTGFNRNQVAAAWAQSLARLHRQDPTGYAHRVELHPGKGHWMDLEDRAALEWMARFTRDPLPHKVVWRQDDVLHSQFYWLAVPGEEEQPCSEVIAERSGQTIRITHAYGIETVTILLNDEMLDLDRPVTAYVNNKQVFQGKVPRTLLNIQQSLHRRHDPRTCFPAQLTVRIPRPASTPLAESH